MPENINYCVFALMFSISYVFALMLTTKKNKTTRIERIRKSHIPHWINKKSGEREGFKKNLSLYEAPFVRLLVV